MKYRNLYLLIIAFILATVIVSCGSDNELPSAKSDISNVVSVKLAPADTDQKVYITPSTMKYHLANPACFDLNNEIAFMSEAIEMGYTACEKCFPVTQEQPTGMVYVVEGNNHYHYAICQKLNDTKTIIPKEIAIQQGFTGCPYCTNEYISPEPHVYILPNDHEFYHIVGCSKLTDDKELRLKALAIEQGYKPCPECGVQISVRGGIVYICPTAGEVYHGIGCPYLDNCNSIQTISRSKLSSMLTPTGKLYEPCSLCRGTPYKD